MRTLWTIKLLQHDSGYFKVEIRNHDRCETRRGRGPIPELAYANAENQHIFKPGFLRGSQILMPTPARRSLPRASGGRRGPEGTSP